MRVEVQDKNGAVRTFEDCYPTFSTFTKGLLFIDNDRGMQAWYRPNEWLDIIVFNDKAT